MTNKIANLLLNSWRSPEGIHSTPSILDWVKNRNEAIFVNIRKTNMAETGWFYDEITGRIVNEKRSFFQIAGIEQTDNVSGYIIQQPIIIQDEIGYLGILCKVFDGILHFLMQAKIEPGNVNKIQISPTIQATKSNFTGKHGGNKPAYLDYFLNASNHTVVVDQIQSEQSSRFLKKRNRNIIIIADDNTKTEETPNHKWMTLGQIKQLMKIDNIVNMDTRTVISCIPFHLTENKPECSKIYEEISRVYQAFNDLKMFAETKTLLLPLYSLSDWELKEHNGTEEFSHKTNWHFKIVFYDISIEGREVARWGQPLFEAVGKAFFGLFTATEHGVQYFLVHIQPEIGCFDTAELGPTVQLEAGHKAQESDGIAALFFRKYKARAGIKHDVILSEEGGRFYHEQNYNVIIETQKAEISVLPQGYFWLTHDALCTLVQTNNCLNIQLRNLLSLLEP
jgi:oxidase EvaA